MRAFKSFLIVMFSSLLVYSCNSSKDNDLNLDQYIEIKYVGEDYDGYRRLIISETSIDKFKVLRNDTSKYIYDDQSLAMDTIFVVERIVDDVIFNKVWNYIRSDEGEKFKGEIDYDESPLVGYQISLYQNGRILASDVCVSNNKCQEYFTDLVAVLRKVNASGLEGDIDRFYMKRLNNPGWGPPRE